MKGQPEDTYRPLKDCLIYSDLFVGCKRMRLALIGDDIPDLGYALYRAFNRLFSGLIVPVLDLLVVLCIPVDEYAHADKDIIRLAFWDNALLNALSHRQGHSTLGRAKHLHRLISPFDRDLIEQNRGGLGGQVV